MVRDIIDDRLVGALHIRAMDRGSFKSDPAVEHVAFQAGTLNALMDGHLGGDATVGEVLVNGFDNPESNFEEAIALNPNCPLHYL